LVSLEEDGKTVFTGIIRKNARMLNKNELDQKTCPMAHSDISHNSLYILLSQAYCSMKPTYVKLKRQIFVRVSKQDAYYNFTLSTVAVISVKSTLITFFQHLHACA